MMVDRTFTEGEAGEGKPKGFSPWAWALGRGKGNPSSNPLPISGGQRARAKALEELRTAIEAKSPTAIVALVQGHALTSAEVDSIKFVGKFLHKDLASPATPMLAMLHASEWDIANLFAQLGCAQQASECLRKLIMDGFEIESSQAMFVKLVQSGHADPYSAFPCGHLSPKAGWEPVDAIDLAILCDKDRFILTLIEGIPAAHARGLVDGPSAIDKAVGKSKVKWLSHSWKTQAVGRAAQKARADLVELVARKQIEDAASAPSEERILAEQAKAAAKACEDALLTGRFTEATSAMAGRARPDQAWAHLDAVLVDAPAAVGCEALLPAGGAWLVGVGLHCAMMSRFESVAWLAEKGPRSDLDRQLLLACRHGAPSAAAALILAGANPLARTRAMAGAKRDADHAFVPGCFDQVDALEICARLGHLETARIVAAALIAQGPRGASAKADRVASLERARRGVAGAGAALLDVSSPAKMVLTLLDEALESVKEPGAGAAEQGSRLAEVEARLQELVEFKEEAAKSLKEMAQLAQQLRGELEAARSALAGEASEQAPQSAPSAQKILPQALPKMGASVRGRSAEISTAMTQAREEQAKAEPVPDRGGEFRVSWPPGRAGT